MSLYTCDNCPHVNLMCCHNCLNEDSSPILHPKTNISDVEPIFNKGDVIRHKQFPKDYIEIVEVFNGYYYFKPPYWAVRLDDYKIKIEEQDNYIKIK